MPSVDFLLKIKLLWLFICLVPKISCKHILDSIGSTLSIFLWLQMDTAKQSLEWHDVLGLERHSITRIFRYPLLIFVPHLNLAPAHADKEFTYHHRKCWKGQLCVCYFKTDSLFWNKLGYNNCTDRIKLSPSPWAVLSTRWVHSCEWATQFVFLSSYLPIMTCTGWQLNLAAEPYLILLLEWKWFLVLDLHLSPEFDMESAPIILLEQHMFSDQM
jgi:hypothetical protein